MSYSENNIKPLSPVIRGEFQGVLDKQTKQSLHYRKEAAQKQRNKINHISFKK
ncbi:hypothetical protein KHA80_18425 [Anaerobacillus sp. HL2]|nr:hypothetical protein KHA80_18425 [Anaerobacillus sp. HL2]